MAKKTGSKRSIEEVEAVRDELQEDLEETESDLREAHEDIAQRDRLLKKIEKSLPIEKAQNLRDQLESIIKAMGEIETTFTGKKECISQTTTAKESLNSFIKEYNQEGKTVSLTDLQTSLNKIASDMLSNNSITPTLSNISTTIQKELDNCKAAMKLTLPDVIEGINSQQIVYTLLTNLVAQGKMSIQEATPDIENARVLQINIRTTLDINKQHNPLLNNLIQILQDFKTQLDNYTNHDVSTAKNKINTSITRILEFQAAIEKLDGKNTTTNEVKQLSSLYEQTCNALSASVSAIVNANPIASPAGQLKEIARQLRPSTEEIVRHRENMEAESAKTAKTLNTTKEKLLKIESDQKKRKQEEVNKRTKFFAANNQPM